MIIHTFRGFMQLIGVLAVGLVIVFGFLAWRLTAGPISLAFLSPYFENALKSSDGAFAVKLDDTILTWSGETNTLEIRVEGAKAIGESGTVMAEIPDLSVTLSGGALLRGKLAPRSISIRNPALNLTRQIHGGIELDLPEANDTRGGAAVAGVIVQQFLAPADTAGPLSFLRRVRIINGDLTINDRLTNTVWRSDTANIDLSREFGTIVGQADLDFDVGEEKASFAISGIFDISEESLKLDVGFANLNPRLFARIHPRLDLGSFVDAPVSGTVTATALAGGETPEAEFVLSTDAGHILVSGIAGLELPIESAGLRGRFDQARATVLIEELSVEFPKEGVIQLPDPVDHGFPLRGLKLTGRYFLDFDWMDIAKLSLELDGPTASLTGSVQEIGGDIEFEVNGVISDMPFDRLAEFWPAQWGEDPRNWIFANMAGGMFSEATVRLFGTYNEANGFSVSAINGGIAIDDTQVTYVEGLPPAVGVSGRAKYNAKRFDIAVTGGTSNGLNVRGGTVVFTGLDEFDQFADIDVIVDGPLQNALSLIEMEPLKFASAAGVDPTAMAGATSTRLKLRFLAKRDLTFDEVEIEANSTLRDVRAGGLIYDLDLLNGQLDLTVDRDGMNLTGRVQVAGADTEVGWQVNFAGDPAVRSRQTIKARLDAEQRQRVFGLKSRMFGQVFLEGPTDIDAVLVRDREGIGEVSIKVGLTGAELAIPRFGWRKRAGTEARGNITARLDGDTLLHVPSFSIGGGGLEITGFAGIRDGNLQRVTISRLAFGETDLSGIIIPGDDGWDMDVRGPKLDLTAWLDTDDQAGEEQERTASMTISLNFDTVRLQPERALANVAGALVFDGKLWRRMELQAALDGGGSLKLDLRPGNGRRSLKIRSDDAGAVLRTFDLYDEVVGGKLLVEGVYKDDEPKRPLAGRATISDFRVTNTPVLARLLSVASLTGILELLTGEGLAFSTLDVPFVDRDGVIAVTDARAIGLSLGFSASGAIDTNASAIDLSGTFVPAYVLNSLLGRLPVVGQVFTGGEEGGGVFAADYSIRGRIEEPDVQINPLSALTPGPVRKFLRILEQKSEAPPAGTDAPRVEAN